MDSLISLYYPSTNVEFELIVKQLYKTFPIKYFTKPYFCALTNQEYARRIAFERANWSNKTKSVHILRFLMQSSKIAKYAKCALDNPQATIMVPQKYLQELNSNLIGYIECIEKVDLINETNQIA